MPISSNSPLIVNNPIWLSISEAAKFSGVNNKTIRRAVQAQKIKYKIAKNKYYIELSSLIVYIYSKTKLVNKFNYSGFGQYIKEFKK
jgi:hypothetical protein